MLDYMKSVSDPCVLTYMVLSLKCNNCFASSQLLDIQYISEALTYTLAHDCNEIEDKQREKPKFLFLSNLGYLKSFVKISEDGSDVDQNLIV